MPSPRLLAALLACTLVPAGCGAPPLPDQQICHGGRLGNIQARDQALTEGYDINREHDCITRASWEQIAAERKQHAQQQLKQREERAQQQMPADADNAAGRPTLAEARAGLRTTFSLDAAASPLPSPPARLFVRHDYLSDKQPLAAFVSPDPGDGQHHPAIVWLTGGDSNSLDDFWTPGPPANDQSASAYRDAGVVMMFPTLRGGNSNPGRRELAYGEVDDVIAAGRALAALPYVDPQQIYLGGHSTGATLALLVAEVENPFRTVFAFGPVADITDYGPPLVPARLSGDEARLRSPGRWLHSLQTPTWVIEGINGNHAGLQTLCREPRNPRLQCLAVPGHDHFSVLDAANRRIAAQLFLGDSSQPLGLSVEDLAPPPTTVAR